jgi:hypothetical protein
MKRWNSFDISNKFVRKKTCVTRTVQTEHENSQEKDTQTAEIDTKDEETENKEWHSKFGVDKEMQESTVCVFFYSKS